ncbi:GDSL-type esterase/lipase family protein [uncultured Microbacterium sp.]|uniref:GDSL-type esterase/lipase family protein n=1 Tax=uncultured Microbacterium sp. TaxID=191216 RepID=UPI0025D5D0C5|nr:GDSL-type esterase/lipase family protein [uncultured Microbacterium sp.]
MKKLTSVHRESRQRRIELRWVAVSTAAIMILLTSATPAAATIGATSTPEDQSASPGESTGSFDDRVEEVPPADRDAQLGADWDSSKDVAWSTIGDENGFHILVGRKSEGYAWHTIATLGGPDSATDRWIGNACASSTGDKLAVAYAPRSAASDEKGLALGASAAIVDLQEGTVVPLAGSFSLAYFSPACGSDGTATFSSYNSDGATAVSVISTADASTLKTLYSPVQVTSATFFDGEVVAASSTAIVKIGDDSALTEVVPTSGTAYDLTPLQKGKLAFAVPSDGKVDVSLLENQNSTFTTTTLAQGKSDQLGLARDSLENLHLLGEVEQEQGSAGVNIKTHPTSDAFASVSTQGELAIESTALASDIMPSAAEGEQGTVLIDAREESTGSDLLFKAQPDGPNPPNMSPGVELGSASNDGQESPVGAVLAGNARTVANTSSPSCAVPRNDPQNQAMQPSPREVEWAVTRAVNGTLTTSRPANWQNLGMPAYSPQGLFPRTSLVGGGRVPIQIMLGILAQESNFWQASRYTVPGVTGNPLVGNYYGTDRGSANADAWWKVDFNSTDCGYGIAQVTDLMRVGEMPYQQQRAIALDFEANIARGLQILSEKWNQTRSAGMTINNGDPQHIENWFYALWAYNTGFHPKPSSGSGPWGVGWSNNPVNPIYPSARKPFLQDSPQDAANPQRWPYPEKVLGFAAHSVQFLQSVDQGTLGDTFNYGPAFAPSWWRATDGNEGRTNRANVKPPRDLFCDSSNFCATSSSTNPSSPCYHKDSDGQYDSVCWYNKPATWKNNCSETCSYESATYTKDSARPAAPNSYPPNCSVAGGLPSNALIVDNVPNGTGAARPGCSAQPTVGSFKFTFANSPSGGVSPAEVDLHQLGSGFNGQFFFTRERVQQTDAAFNGALNVSGTWTFGGPLASWGQVYAHMPNHGAWSQQARYVIETGAQTVERVVNQRNYANTWVPLGALQFNGTPRITLTNFSSSYDENLKDEMSGVTDIAWDAVAIVPLAQKPSEFVVALGDSYSSGEGTSATDGSDFFRGSDHNGTKTKNSAGNYAEDPQRNACHRSYEAWPFKMTVPSLASSGTVGELVRTRSPLIDFHLLACAGAETRNVVSRATPGAARQYGEANQLDRGFVDANTTLVTMTIGGNDVGFGPIIMSCIKNSFVGGGGLCRDAPWTGAGAAVSETSQTYVGKRISQLKTDLAETLRQIRQKAPNAKILLQGYPKLFDQGSSCVGIPENDMPWLNSVADTLNATLTATAREAGPMVVYANPQYEFQGSTLCSSTSAITGLTFALTPGDKPIFEWTGPGPNFGAPMSQQSIHPNAKGTSLYAKSANGALRTANTALSGTVVAGATTTYYATFRYHSAGPAAMNVTAAALCSGELRLGLRKQTGGAAGIGEQHTQSLAWSKPDALQNFRFTGSGGSEPDLPTGWYALNARMTDPCPSDSPRSWSGTLRW